MKKLLNALIISLFMMTSITVVSASEKGSQMRSENASDEAIFNKAGDWFATIGKSDTEKAKIKAERKAERMKKKALKKAKKKKKMAEKEMKDGKAKAGSMKKDMDKKMKGSKGMQKGS